MNKKLIFFAPLLVLLAVCALLIAGLNQNPKEITSALIGKPVPAFYQADLQRADQIRTVQDFPKQPFLFNLWGSWCGYCKEEHPFLMEIAQTVPIVGINYRDNPQNGIEMLAKMGDPFVFSINDSRGEFAMKLGVDGAPETYLIDEFGVIRYRHSGLLNREDWEKTLLPKYQELLKK